MSTVDEIDPQDLVGSPSVERFDVKRDEPVDSERNRRFDELGVLEQHAPLDDCPVVAAADEVGAVHGSTIDWARRVTGEGNEGDVVLGRQDACKLRCSNCRSGETASNRFWCRYE